MSADQYALIAAPDASAQPEPGKRICDNCQHEFVPEVTWQRFCDDRCRRAFHRTHGRKPLRAVVSRVNILSRGKVSVTLHFGIDERTRAVTIMPKQEIEVLL